MKAIGLIVTILFLLKPSLILADDVFRHKDSSGNVVYSSKPATSDQKPAQLPEITRENLGRKIKSIREKTPSNCQAHGGMDCSAGADSDGSVICLDGYRDSVLRFRFNCMEAKLSEEPIAFVDSSGQSHEPKSYPNDSLPDSLLGSVRNVSNVEASNVQLLLNIPGYPPQIAQGPSSIDPYGAADYTFSLNMLSTPPTLVQLKKLKTAVKCTNCR